MKNYVIINSREYFILMMEYALFLLGGNMKEILNFINNNAGVVSLITLIVTIIYQVLMTKNDRRYKEKQESKKERKISA